MSTKNAIKNQAPVTLVDSQGSAHSADGKYTERKLAYNPNGLQEKWGFTDLDLKHLNMAAEILYKRYNTPETHQRLSYLTMTLEDALSEAVEYQFKETKTGGAPPIAKKGVKNRVTYSLQGIERKLQRRLGEFHSNRNRQAKALTMEIYELEEKVFGAELPTLNGDVAGWRKTVQGQISHEVADSKYEKYFVPDIFNPYVDNRRARQLARAERAAALMGATIDELVDEFIAETYESNPSGAALDSARDMSRPIILRRLGGELLNQRVVDRLEESWYYSLDYKDTPAADYFERRLDAFYLEHTNEPGQDMSAAERMTMWAADCDEGVRTATASAESVALLEDGLSRSEIDEIDEAHERLLGPVVSNEKSLETKRKAPKGQAKLRREAYPLLAKTFGLPPTEGLTHKPTDIAANKKLIEQPGMVEKALRDWDHGEITEATEALFFPWGVTDPADRDPIADFVRERGFQDGLNLWLFAAQTTNPRLRD